jgi:outer membrane lipoprotein-sorting protein
MTRIRLALLILATVPACLAPALAAPPAKDRQGLDTLIAQTRPLQLSPQSGPQATPKADTKADPAKVEEPPSIDRINAYFNGMRGMRANFVQTSPDGRRFGGVLHLLRPGRMRFEYAEPATLEVVADGRSVAIRDRKLKTQDVYFIGQTPLKFLLQPRIDVAKDSKVTSLRRVGSEIVLMLEDRSTFGGTSKIRVVFNGADYALKEWMVSDAQGNDTRVALANIDLTAQPSAALFVIDEQKIIEPKN